jgi:hypothetical protein
MSDLYEKQVEWKRNQASRARTSSGKDDEDVTFQPVFFTSKDTSRKFRVTEKVETLSAVAGSHHVDRFKKAAQLREEAHRKLFGGPTASATAAAAASASVTAGNGSSATLKKAAKLGTVGAGSGMQNTGYASIGLRTGTATTGTAAYYSGAGTGFMGSGDDALPVPHPPVEESRSSSSSSSGSSSSSNTADIGTLPVPSSAAAAAPPNAWGGCPSYRMPHNAAASDASAFASTSPSPSPSADDYAVVEILERERREWHAERTKLVQCIHLQQLELAARASAAQETAGAIAKEFAASIEEYEARLVLVESSVQRELEEVKDMLRRALAGQGQGQGHVQGQGQGDGESKAKGEAKARGEAKAAHASGA